MSSIVNILGTFELDFSFGTVSIITERRAKCTTKDKKLTRRLHQKQGHQETTESRPHRREPDLRICRRNYNLQTCHFSLGIRHPVGDLEF